MQSSKAGVAAHIAHAQASALSGATCRQTDDGVAAVDLHAETTTFWPRKADDVQLACCRCHGSGRLWLLLRLAAEAATTKGELDISAFATKAAAAATAEELLEDLVRVDATRPEWTATATSTSALLQGLLATNVVNLALLRIRQNGVRCGYLLEFLLGLFLIVRIFVRMPLDRELTKCLLYGTIVSRPWDAQDFIVVCATVLGCE